MKAFTTIALTTLFSISAVAAVPLDGARYVAQNIVEKRSEDIVWKTVIKEVVETIDITTTIWITPGQSHPSPIVQAPAPVAPKSTPAAAPVPKPVEPVQIAQPQPALQIKPSSAAPVAKASPAPAPAPVVAAPKPSAPAPAPAAQASSSSSPPTSDNSFSLSGYGQFLPDASHTYKCTSGTPCGTPNDPDAKASFYSMTDPVTGAHGLGACGTFEDATSQDFVAIDKSIMGSLSSGTPMNPLCGQTVTVKNTATGKTATGVVADKCPHCKTDYGIDLSNHLFDQLASEDQGLFSVEWWFN